MNEDNVAIRLKGFIDYLGLSSSQFADQCGIPRPSLSQLLSGRNKKISDVLVGQIHAAFPDLSVLWLLFGEGDMLVASKSLVEGDSDDSGCVHPDDLDKSISDNNYGRDNGNEELPYRKGGLHVSSGRLESIIAEKETEIEELRREIERMKKSPRKVAQITVYYDDSTFETFYPGSGGSRGIR